MVMGFADLHNHQFAEWAFGGKLFWGQAYGPPKEVLGWCTPAHGVAGMGDVLTDIMRAALMGRSFLGHLEGGWPQFDGWPRWDSMSHQTVHEDWLKRAVDGGLRLMVMLAVNSEHVANNVERRPGRSKNDMEAVDLQLQAARDMEAYVDHKHRGPGTGWYRIVETPQQAASVMNEGKLAVVLGIEVDYLFNAYSHGNLSEAAMVAELNKYYGLGVRHIFPIHFDNNGFGGASFDKAPLQNGQLERLQAARSGGELSKLFSPYPFVTEDGSSHGYTARDGRVNTLGLTDLERALIHEAMTRGMIIEVDHMSRKSRTEVLDICEKANYPVCSGHTGFVDISFGEKRHEGNLTGDEVDRIRDLGGLVSVIPLQGHLDQIDTFRNGSTTVEHIIGATSNTLVQAYLYAVTKMQGYPVALGTDFNGFAGVPRPRFPTDREWLEGAVDADRNGPQSTNPVIYPFPNPVTGAPMPAQETGRRTWDINTDGLAHVGLLPDLIADFRAQGLTDADLAPLLGSADGYVRMWEKACRVPPANPAQQLVLANGAVPLMPSVNLVINPPPARHQ
jgi:microsomal dipeptidase-like Zn-dependent dipeptidase